MLDISVLESLIADAGLLSYKGQILSWVKPAIAIQAIETDEATLKIGQSKIGGSPDVPPDFVWPTWHGLPAAFIAQINLAEAAPFDLEHQLPNHGVLYFFASFRWDEPWYSIRETAWGNKSYSELSLSHYDGDFTALVRTPRSDNSPDAQYPASGLRFHNILSLPDGGAWQAELLFPDWHERGPYSEKILEKLRTLQPDVHHQLLGHPRLLQADHIVLRYLSTHGIRGRDLGGISNIPLKELTRHVFLCEIASDFSPHMDFGDEGTAYYWLDHDDLRAGDFSHVWGEMDDY